MCRRDSTLGYSPCVRTLSNINLSYSHCSALFRTVLASSILDTGPPNELFLAKTSRKWQKEEQKGIDQQ